MTADDLLPIVANPAVKPRPPTATSIPGILGMLQDEWDAQAAEAFQLRKQLYATRQELSQVLYQQDAAVRTCARLMEQRDAARKQLAESGAAAPAAAAEAPPPKRAAAGEASEAAPEKRVRFTEGDETVALEPDALAIVESAYKQLTDGRKGRAVPQGTPSAADVRQKYGSLGAWPSDGTVIALDSCESPSVVGGNMLVTTASGKASLVDGETGAVRVSVTGAEKTTGACLLPYPTTANLPLAALASQDGCVRLYDFGRTDGDALVDTATPFGAEMDLAIAAHSGTRGAFVYAASGTGGWALIDTTANMTPVASRRRGSAAAARPCVASHPDGILFGTASSRDGTVTLWDCRNATTAMTLECAGGGIHSLSMSENGYYIAVAGADGASVYDLRKSKEVAKWDEHGPSYAVAFDAYGTLMGAAFNKGSVCVYEVKKASTTLFDAPLGGAGPSSAFAFNANATRAVAAYESGLVVIGYE